VRAGFDIEGRDSPTDSKVSTESKVSPDSRASADWAAAPTVAVTSANDDCSNPAVVDLAPFAAGKTVTVTVDFAGAKSDFPYGTNEPDVVVRYVNAPSTYRMICAGSPWIRASYFGQNPTGCGEASSVITRVRPCGQLEQFEGPAPVFDCVLKGVTSGGLMTVVHAP
jgi:hypothetical protein